MLHSEVFQFLTDEDLRKLVPAAYTVGTSSISTDRYKHVNTIQVLRTLASRGWRPHKAYQTRSKAEKNVGFERHFIRLRNPNLYVGTPENIEVVPEIILVNSYGARCSFKLYAGATRTLTGNEFVFDSDSVPNVVLAHSDHYYVDPMTGKKDQSKRAVNNWGKDLVLMLNNMNSVISIIDRMKKVNTNRNDQKEMAQEAISSRWDYQWPKTGWEALLKSERFEDETNDLWMVYNRVHEKILKGGWVGAGGKAIKPLVEANRELKTNGRMFQVAQSILERLEDR